MNYRKWKFNKNRSTRSKNNNIRFCLNRFNYAPKKTFCIRSELKSGPSITKRIQNESQSNANIYSLSQSLLGSASVGIKPSHDSESFNFDMNDRPFEPVITSTPKKIKHLSVSKGRNQNVIEGKNSGLSCKELLSDDWSNEITGLNHVKEKRSGNIENIADIDFSLDNNIFDNFSSNTTLNKQLKDIENHLFESVHHKSDQSSNLVNFLELEMLNLNTSKQKDNRSELELEQLQTVENFQKATKNSEFDFERKLDLFVKENDWNFGINNNPKKNLDLKFSELNDQSFHFDLNINNKTHVDLNGIPKFNMEELASSFKFENTLNFPAIKINKKSYAMNHSDSICEPLNLNKSQSTDMNATINLNTISEPDLNGKLAEVCKMKTIPVQDQVAEWLTQQVQTPTNEAYLKIQNIYGNRNRNYYGTNRRANFLSQQFPYGSTKYDSISQKVAYKENNRKEIGNIRNTNAFYRKHTNAEKWNNSGTLEEQNICRNFSQNSKVIEPINRSKQFRSKYINDQFYVPKTYFNEPNIHIKNMNVY